MKENKITQTDYYSLSTTTASRIQTSSKNNISNYFTTAQNLLVDRFSIEISTNKKKNRRRIELAIGDKFCLLFYKLKHQ